MITAASCHSSTRATSPPSPVITRRVRDRRLPRRRAHRTGRDRLRPNSTGRSRRSRQWRAAARNSGLTSVTPWWPRRNARGRLGGLRGEGRPNLPLDGEELLGVDIDGMPGAAERNVEDLADARRPPAPDGHPVAEQDRFLDVVRDEDDGDTVLLPHAQQEFVHADPGDRVEGAERLAPEDAQR